MTRRKTTAEFIQQAKSIHGDRYDYSGTVYTLYSKPVSFKCLSCQQTIRLSASNHLSGYGCRECHPRFPKCSDVLNTEIIIQHFRQIHGDKFDYSHVVYVSARKKVKIKCRSCNKIFEQAPRMHKRGRGCPLCRPNRKLSKEEVLKGFFEKHGNKYDYSKVVFKNSSSKVTIICNTCCKEFSQRPSDHKRGQGCPYCANNIRHSRDQVIKDFADKHGNKYDYKAVVYKNNRKKVEIKCNTCGHMFMQSPNRHKSGNGCPKCANNMTFTREIAIQKFRETHGDRYDYSEVEYINSRTKVKIGCNECEAWFFQNPSEHIRGTGCPTCNLSSLLAQETVIDQFKDTHGDDYDYSEVVYKGIDSKVKINCKRCSKSFLQSPYNHRKGNGCPHCACGKSERLFGRCLETLGFEAKKVRPEWLINPETGYKLELDYYIPAISVAFEIQGIQHYKAMENWNGHEGLKRQQARDQVKRDLCKENGVRLIEYDLRNGRDETSMLQFIIEKIGFYVIK